MLVRCGVLLVTALIAGGPALAQETAVATGAAPSASTATATRAKAPVEQAKEIEVPAGLNGTEQTSWERRRLAQVRARTALKGLDAAVRYQLSGVGACAAAAGITGPQEADLTLSIGGDGAVGRVKVAGAGEAVRGCLVAAFDGRPLPTLTDDTPTLTWHVAFEAVPLPAAPPSPYVPIDPAGSARLDGDVGFGGVSFGDSPDAHADLSFQRASGELRFYQREGDQGARYCGVAVSGVSYVAAPDVGVFAAIVFVSDPNGAFRVKDAVRDRYGTLRLDPMLDTSYARGARHVVEVRPFGQGVAVTLLDLARGAASDAYGRVPGDPMGKGSEGRRLPRIFADDTAAAP